MKSKDLIYPFPKGHLTAFVHENILVIPQWRWESTPDQIPSWKDVLALSPKLELCSGNGDWVLEQAVLNSDQIWIAVEMRFDRVSKIWAKAKRNNIQNIFIVHGKAQDFCKFFLSDNLISDVFVNFPDPWPKTRHHKHRLFQMPFIEQLYRVLKPGGKLKIVSDDISYLESSLEELERACYFVSTLQPPYLASLDAYGFSYFKQLWEEKGRKIHYLEFQKEERYVAASSIC